MINILLLSCFSMGITDLVDLCISIDYGLMDRWIGVVFAKKSRDSVDFAFYLDVNID